jgi:hypothetical protein
LDKFQRILQIGEPEDAPPRRLVNIGKSLKMRVKVGLTVRRFGVMV